MAGSVKISNSTYSLIISKVYPEVRDGRFQIDLQFVENDPIGIRQGQSLQIRIALGNLEKATMIPSGGFYQTTGGNWIFVLDESEEFAIRKEIKIGMRNPQMYEILEGLTAGEKVITSSPLAFGWMYTISQAETGQVIRIAREAFLIPVRSDFWIIDFISSGI